MICFAAFTPHTPLLIETIGKENIKHLAKTRAAMEELAQSLKASKPDAIFMISSHSVVHEKAFSVNLHDVYEVDFREFGDHSSHEEFEPDLELATAIQRAARTQELPFVFESYASLDYGSGVPLHLLSKNIHPKIIPISYSGYDRKQHMAFGRLLKNVAMNSQKRIAVIASGDLSHCLSSDAPMGFHKEGQKFDEAIRRSIEQFSASTLLTLSEKTVEKAEQCAMRPLLIFFGMLEKIQIHPQTLSYEAPFGVGYLVAQFHL